MIREIQAISRISFSRRKTMNKNIMSVLALMLAITTTYETQAGRGGYFAGGLVTGAVVGSAIANSRRPDVVYVDSPREVVYETRSNGYDMQDELAQLREENADLRAELREARRAARNR